MYFSKTDISHNCKEKDLEICAIKLDTKSCKLIIQSLYKHLEILINFFITITEKFKIQQTEKGDAISILQHSFPRNFPSIKIITITEAEIKSILHTLKQNKTKQK
jgi:hypothetical protein